MEEVSSVGSLTVRGNVQAVVPFSSPHHETNQAKFHCLMNVKCKDKESWEGHCYSYRYNCSNISDTVAKEQHYHADVPLTLNGKWQLKWQMGIKKQIWLPFYI